MPQSVTDWAAQTQEIVAAFEAETGSLPEIEQSLLTLPEFSTQRILQTLHQYSINFPVRAHDWRLI